MWHIVLLATLCAVSCQTDWMGGAGVLGPVSNWGTRYWVGDSVTTASPGQVSLIATQWDYSNWVNHVVESNSGIKAHTQGFMPGDVDADGIADLVAYTADSVVWYKHDGYYNFSKNVIGAADDGGSEYPCVYPCDLDKDGDIDVLVATNGIGCGWFENQNLSWAYHNLDDSLGYHRISATDVELDGHLDVIAVDNSSDLHAGDIYLFRNDGSANFTKELVVDFPHWEGWRVYPADFNGDGWDDLYSPNWLSVYILLNDHTGVFTQSFYDPYWSGQDFDGAWASDIDMDGDVDLVCGGQYHLPYGFYGLLNDGTGYNFDTLFLVGDATKSYMDGGIVSDIDLDGLPDIGGTQWRVGWFRQDSLLAFTLHDIDTISSGWSHWVYAAPLANKCCPSIDLLVTHTGGHIVYENQMPLGFASLGWFESSILEFTSDSACTLSYFGYKACVPNDSALSFYWRAGSDSADIVSSLWNGPYSATVGMNVVDSFALTSTARMFQYKVELKGNDDIAVLYEVWLLYGCPPTGIEDQSDEIGSHQLRASPEGTIFLYLPSEDWVKLIIYDVSGRMIKLVFDGHLPSGTYEFEGPTRSGGYFARLHHTKGTETLKFIKLR